MKFNGTIFSKPQQDQLKEVIGKEVEGVVKKVNDVDARMLNYTGDWVTSNEYHENDVVTWSNGNLYEVIKAHTSSAAIDPSNTEYYKAMTASKYAIITKTPDATLSNNEFATISDAIGKGKSVYLDVVINDVNMVGKVQTIGAHSVEACVYEIGTEELQEHFLKVTKFVKLKRTTRITSNITTTPTVSYTSAGFTSNYNIIIGQ